MKVKIKSLVPAAVLVAIVATALVFSSDSVALAQQSSTANLTIENFVNVAKGCPKGWSLINRCPQGSNTGMVTTIHIDKTQTTIEFPAGPWNVKTVKVIPIPIGSWYEIFTRVPTTSYTFHMLDILGPSDITFKLDKTSIEGACKASDSSPKIRCGTTMGTDGAKIRVIYDWSHSVSK